MISFLNRKVDSVTVAAFLVAFSSLVSRILGLLRDRILAGQYGAGTELDVYYAAFRIPDLIFNLLVLGALSAGFIPVFTGLVKDRESELEPQAVKLVSNIINILLLMLAALSVLGIIGAPWLMHWLTPGFSGHKLQLTIELSRVMFLSPLLLGVSSVFGGVLQSYKKFFVYSLSPIFYNFGIIAGALFLAPRFGVVGLAWGVVIGAAAHMLVQLPSMLVMGWRWQPILALRDKAVLSMLKMTTARTLSLAIGQLNLMVVTIIASAMPEGSLAIFNLANNLQSFPVGIFGISFAIAVFPVLSAEAFNRKKLVEQFSKTLRQVMFFIVPATGMFLALRSQIVRAALGSGSFDWHDTETTMDTMAMFAVSFFAQAAIPLLTRVFYARHDSKTPFYIGLISTAVNLAAAWYLGHRFGVIGLGLSFTLASVVNVIWLWLALRSELGGLDEKRIVWSLFKFSVGTAGALVVVQLAKSAINPFIDMDRFWGVATQGLLAGGLGIAAYLIIVWMLRSEEFDGFKASVMNRLPFKKVAPPDQGEARGI